MDLFSSAYKQILAKAQVERACQTNIGADINHCTDLKTYLVHLWENLLAHIREFLATANGERNGFSAQRGYGVVREYPCVEHVCGSAARTE